MLIIPADYTFRQEDDCKWINLYIAKEWIENERFPSFTISIKVT